MLYGTLAVQTVIQWLYMNQVFCRGGSSRASTFVLWVTNSVPWITVVSGAMENLGYLIADGVIVWRCFHACGGKIIQFSLPMTFFVIEFGESKG